VTGFTQIGLTVVSILIIYNTSSKIPLSLRSSAQLRLHYRYISRRPLCSLNCENRMGISLPPYPIYMQSFSFRSAVLPKMWASNNFYIQPCSDLDLDPSTFKTGRAQTPILPYLCKSCFNFRSVVVPDISLDE